MLRPIIVINVIREEQPPTPQPEPELTSYEKFQRDFDAQREAFHARMDQMFK